MGKSNDKAWDLERRQAREQKQQEQTKVITPEDACEKSGNPTSAGGIARGMGAARSGSGKYHIA